MNKFHIGDLLNNVKFFIPSMFIVILLVLSDNSYLGDVNIIDQDQIKKKSEILDSEVLNKLNLTKDSTSLSSLLKKNEVLEKKN